MIKIIIKYWIIILINDVISYIVYKIQTCPTLPYLLCLCTFLKTLWSASKLYTLKRYELMSLNIMTLRTTTLSIMATRITTLSISTLIITILGIMTLGIMTLGIMTLGIMTLSITKHRITTLSIIIPNLMKLSVTVIIV